MAIAVVVQSGLIVSIGGGGAAFVVPAPNTTATPTFSPVAGTYASTQSVTLACATPSSTIYYTTDGSTPTTGSTVYSTAISVAASQTVKAIATASGFSTSAVGIAAYVISTAAATPTFSPVAGTYGSTQTVTISCSTASPTIYYTLDGSTPTTGSTVYTTPLSVSASETIKAIATASGFAQSSVGSAAYVITTAAATPTFSPAAGSYGSSQSITISSTTSANTIYYTTDGSTPTTGSTVYSAPVVVNASETIKAIATASGFTSSAVGSAAYVISGSGAPTAPTAVFLALQGLTSAGSMDGGGDTTPQQPNKQALSWTQGVAGSGGAITGNKIYRSTTSSTAGFSLYATIAAATGYTDTVATGCVNGTAGSGPPSNPWYKPTATYWYKVTAVDASGNESPQSVCPSYLWYKDGVLNGGPDLSYGVTTNFSATGQWTPTGATCITISFPAGGGGFQPTTGHLVTTWNFAVGMFATLEFDMIAPTTNRPFVTASLISGDKDNYGPTGVQNLYYYGNTNTAFSNATVAGQVCHVTFPLATLTKDYGPGGGSVFVLEEAFYKFFVSDQSGTAGVLKINNLMFNP